LTTVGQMQGERLEWLSLVYGLELFDCHGKH
jgi:hypothetical protein